MTDTYKPLGQAATSDTYSSEGIAYKVPTGTNAAVSSVLITNTNDTDVTYSLSVVPQNETEATTQQVDFGTDYVVEYRQNDTVNGKLLKITTVSSGVVNYLDSANFPALARKGYRTIAASVVGDRLVVALSTGMYDNTGNNRLNMPNYQSFKVAVISTTDMINWTVNTLEDSHADFIAGLLVSGTTYASTFLASITIFNSGVISLVYGSYGNQSGYLPAHVAWLSNYASTQYVDGGSIQDMINISTPWGTNYLSTNPGQVFFDKDKNVAILPVLQYNYGRGYVLYSSDGITYRLLTLHSSGTDLLGYFQPLPSYTLNQVRKTSNGKLALTIYSPWGYSEVQNRIYFADSYEVSLTSATLTINNLSYQHFQAYVQYMLDYKTIQLASGDELLLVSANGWMQNFYNYGLTGKLFDLVSVNTGQIVSSVYADPSYAPANAAYAAITYGYFSGERIAVSVEYLDQSANWLPTNGRVYLASDIVTPTNYLTIGSTFASISFSQYSELQSNSFVKSVEDFHYYKVIPVYSSSIKNKIITKTLSSAGTHTIDGGITLSAGDEIRIYSPTNDVVAHVYGTEITGSSLGYKILGQKYVGKVQYTVPGEGGSGSGSQYYYYGGGPNEDTIIEVLEPVVLYTTPAGKETVVSSIYVTNNDTVQRTFDIAIVPAGETLAVKHHIRWDMPVSASDFDLLTHKITMKAGDSIVVLPSTADKVGFTAFGVEK